MKGRALRRALETHDALRVNAQVPLIIDTTELITPELAKEILRHNKNNRPVNWRRVEEYSAIMKSGQWALHAQGIIIDRNGNLLTGQQRLWAVIYSGVPVYMRISRGSPPETASLLDRGRSQSSRDLASRITERKHSPFEVSVARAVLVLDAIMRPSADILARLLIEHSTLMAELANKLTGTKKTKSIIMVVAAFLHEAPDSIIIKMDCLQRLADRLDEKLNPDSAVKCWGKGAAFLAAMEMARDIVIHEVRTGSSQFTS